VGRVAFVSVRALPALLLAALAAAAYAGSFTAPFVFDDVPRIVQNPYLEGIWPLWQALRSPDHVESSFAGRPVASYTLALSYALSGREVWGYHALSLALHVANVWLLLAVLTRTFRRPALGLGTAAPGLAFAAAALWTARSANARSRADWNRSPGSFSRQCATMRESSRGSAGSAAARSGAGSRRIAAIVSAPDLPANGLRPATHSKSTHASEKMSLGRSAGSPRTCSGDM